MEKISNYKNSVLDVIITQFKEKYTIEGIPKAMSVLADDLEDAMFEIRNNFWLDTAVGNQLNIIGDILNLLREGRNDDDFRNFIRSEVGATFSGTPEQIINKLKSSYDYTYVEMAFGGVGEPASFYILSDGQPYVNQTILFVLSPAGVGGLFITGLVDETGTLIEDAHGNVIGTVGQVYEDVLTDETGDTIDDDTDSAIETIEII